MVLDNELDQRIVRMRAVAILLVVIVHVSNRLEAVRKDVDSSSPEPILHLISQVGLYGVQIFFFISGYLMMTLYGERGTSFDRRKFWIRRLARIFPLWILFLLLAASTRVVDGGFFGFDFFAPAQEKEVPLLAAFIATMLFLGWTLPNLWNSIILGGWSIQAEMFHYSIFSLGARVGHKFWLWSGVVFGLLEFVANLQSDFTPLNGLANLGITSSFTFFWMGLATSESHIRGVSVWATLANIFKANPLASLLFLSAFILSSPPFGNNLGALTTVVIAWQLFSRLRLDAKSKLSRSAGAIATVSYTMYFVHFWLLIVMKYLLESFLVHNPDKIWLITSRWELLWIAWVIITLGVSFCISRMVYNLVERPAIMLGKRLTT